MGLPQYPPFDLKAIVQENQDKGNSNGYTLWNKVFEAQAKRRWQGTKLRKMCRKNKNVMMRRKRNVLMKRPAATARLGLGGTRRRANNGIERRVRTLKRLVPNGNGDCVGLDGLFRETADYILSLQMRVRVMQIMVKFLTGATSDQE